MAGQRDMVSAVETVEERQVLEALQAMVPQRHQRNRVVCQSEVEARQIQQHIFEEKMAVRRFVVYAKVPTLNDVRQELDAERRKEQEKKAPSKKPERPEDAYLRRLGEMHRQLDEYMDMAQHLGGDTYRRWQHLMADCLVAEMNATQS